MVAIEQSRIEKIFRSDYFLANDRQLYRIKYNVEMKTLFRLNIRDIFGQKMSLSLLSCRVCQKQPIKPALLSENFFPFTQI